MKLAAAAIAGLTALAVAALVWIIRAGETAIEQEEQTP